MSRGPGPSLLTSSLVPSPSHVVVGVGCPLTALPVVVGVGVWTPPIRQNRPTVNHNWVHA